MPFLRFALLILLLAVAAPGQAEEPVDPERLPGSAVTKGAEFSAWLILPTRRYAHFVRANDVEAGGLRVEMADKRRFSLVLPDTLVFEDSTVRLADLDGDGRDEIIVVLTSLEAGAALAVYELVEDQIALRAQTPFIGKARRWLNPAGIADFDGDGLPEIALVQMPHLVKRLEFWQLGQNGLARIASFEDVSNHMLGTPQTPLAVAADFDGNGVVDLAIPSGAGDVLRFLSLAGSEIEELNRVPLGGIATGDLVVESGDSGLVVLVPLADGGVRRIRFDASPG